MDTAPEAGATPHSEENDHIAPRKFSVLFGDTPIAKSEVLAFDESFAMTRLRTDNDGQLELPSQTDLILIRANGPLLGCVLAPAEGSSLHLKPSDFNKLDVKLHLDEAVPDNARLWIRIAVNGTMATGLAEYPPAVRDVCSKLMIVRGVANGSWYVPRGHLVAVTPGAHEADSETLVAHPTMWMDASSGARVRSAFYADQDREIEISMGVERLPDAETGKWDGLDFDVPHTPFVHHE